MFDSSKTVSRRHALVTGTVAASAMALGLQPKLGRAASLASVPLQLGLVTYQWGKDLDLPELLRVCDLSGFTGVELRTTHKHGVEPSLSPSARAEVRKRFADSSVKLVGLGSACEYHAVDPSKVQKNVDETKAFLELSAELGGSGVKVRPNGLPKEVPVDKTLEQIGRTLHQLGEFAASLGQQIRVEVHGAGTQEIPNMHRIMSVADHPNVAVCWNCNDTDLRDPGFEENFTSLERWMGTVHIHDLRPGKVNYPWAKLFPRLRACQATSFTGWCLLEDGATPPDILAAMRENYQEFRKLTD